MVEDKRFEEKSCFGFGKVYVRQDLGYQVYKIPKNKKSQMTTYILKMAVGDSRTLGENKRSEDNYVVVYV